MWRRSDAGDPAAEPIGQGDTYEPFRGGPHAYAWAVLRYRQILVRVMESEGFTNYEKEWWHFSYPVPGALPFDRVIH